MGTNSSYFNEKSDEALLRAAALQYYEEDAEEAERYVDEHLVDPPPELAERMRRQFLKEVQRHAWKRRLRRGLKRAGGVAVAACAAFGLCFWQVDAFQQEVRTFFVTTFERYSKVTTVDGQILDKPFGWPEDIYLTWLPTGFSLKNVSLDDVKNQIEYQNYDKQTVTLSIFDINQIGYPDAENMIENSIQIQSYTAIQYIKSDGMNSMIKLSIPELNKEIWLQGEISPDTLIKVAEKLHFPE